MAGWKICSRGVLWGKDKGGLPKENTRVEKEEKRKRWGLTVKGEQGEVEPL